MPKLTHRENRNFPTTHWSLVRAGAAEGEGNRPALAQLLVNYLAPMRMHLITRNGVHPQQADDLLQSFVADRLLEDNLLAFADHGRGRFRSFLLTALDHFAFNHFRALRTQKRSPRGHVMAEEQIHLIDPSPTVDQAFDIAWAREVLDQAVTEMREGCRVADRPDVWGIFEARILLPILESQKTIPYRELLDQFGIASSSDASNLLVTAIRMFRRVLKSVIGRYELDEHGIQTELDDLRRILAQGGAR